MGESPGKTWKAWWELAESQSFSFGRRLPPESQSFKRFHYALSHAYKSRARLQWSPKRRPGSAWDFDLSGAHRFYRYRSDPHPEAFMERKETLNYNRLESSFLASAYGGFYNSSELVDLVGQAHTAELRPDFGWNGESGWRLEAALPLAAVWLRARFRDRTITRTLFSTTVERTLFWNIHGPAVVAAPSLSLGWTRGPLSLSLRAAHALPLWMDLRSDADMAGAPGNGEEDRYPWQSNALLVEIEAGLDF